MGPDKKDIHQTNMNKENIDREPIYFERPGRSLKIQRLLLQFFLPLIGLFLLGYIGYFLIAEYLPSKIDSYEQPDARENTPTFEPSTVRTVLVEDVQGLVWSGSNINQLTPLKGDSSMNVGQLMLVEEDSSASLVFPDGTVFTVEENSQVIVDTMNSILYKVILNSGGLRIEVPEYKDRRVVVDAAGVLITSNGGKFKVNSYQQVEVQVERGELKVTDKDANTWELKEMQNWSEQLKEVTDLRKETEDETKESTDTTPANSEN